MKRIEHRAGNSFADSIAFDDRFCHAPAETANLDSDVNHCGACDNVCSGGPGDIPICITGSCA